MLIKLLQIAVLVFALQFNVAGQDHGSHDGHNHGDKGAATSHNAEKHEAGHSEAGNSEAGHHEKFDPTNTAIHHISDANVLTILEKTFPLPTFLYSKADGWKIMSSGAFEPGHHENGHKAIDRYVLHQGSVYRVADTSFPMGEHIVSGFDVRPIKVQLNGKEKIKDQAYATINGKEYTIDRRSTWDGGFLGGGVTSFYDFSITKNVLALILVSLFLMWIFLKAARFYKSGEANRRAPSGMTGILETMFLFIRDEVAIPFIGEKYMKYIPILMSLFFFIVGLNLFGQIPFLGGINVTGNLTITMVLAVIVFILVNLNGKKDYWKHIFWMPGVPTFVKFILTPVEIMSLFIKPLTLMLRLAGNISAGHIAILSFIGLIFIFGDSGQSMSGSLIGTAMSVPLTLFMMSIELIVAFVQAFVFTILTASYIGAAIEEHH